MIDTKAFVSGIELWQWRNAAIEAASAKGISPKEVDWLLEEIAGIDRLALRLETYKNWSVIQLKLTKNQLNELWQRRLNEHLPVQYIAGVTSWRQFKIAVDNSVLIPRPETECLIDLAQAVIKQTPGMFLDKGHWADLGTGSGVLALGLADTFPSMTIHAVDYSQQALSIAQKNARNLGFKDDRIKFYQGSWWQPLEFLKGQFSGMVSNPPYIPTSMLADLQPEVINHEPYLALDGGESGLDCISYLVKVSPDYLQSNGVFLIEMMAGQAQTVKQMLENNGNYCNIQIHPDLAGIERFAVAFRS